MTARSGSWRAGPAGGGVVDAPSALLAGGGEPRHRGGPAEEVSEPAEPEVRALLEAYIAAFENADPAALERVLRKDAALEPVGSLTWFSGRDTCLRYVTQFLGAPGDWQMAATTANGQPAAAAYLRGPDGIHRAFGLAVLTATGAGIARIVVFGDPGLVTRFGLPSVRDVETRPPAPTSRSTDAIGAATPI